MLMVKHFKKLIFLVIVCGICQNPLSSQTLNLYGKDNELIRSFSSGDLILLRLKCDSCFLKTGFGSDTIHAFEISGRLNKVRNRKISLHDAYIDTYYSSDQNYHTDFPENTILSGETIDAPINDIVTLSYETKTEVVGRRMVQIGLFSLMLAPPLAIQDGKLRFNSNRTFWVFGTSISTISIGALLVTVFKGGTYQFIPFHGKKKYRRHKKGHLGIEF